MYWRENTDILSSNLKRTTKAKRPLMFSQQFTCCHPEIRTAEVLGKMFLSGAFHSSRVLAL